MTTIHHRAEGIANTTTLDTTNTGGPAGTAANAIISTATASTTHVAHGQRSHKYVNTAVSTTSIQDTTSLGTKTVVRGREYVWIDGSPPANLRVAQVDNGGVFACGVGMTTGRLLRLADSTSTQMAVGTSAIPTGQWVRIEWRMVASATVGQASAKVWFSADSTGAADDSISSAASFNTRANFDRYQIGNLFSGNQTYTRYGDETAWTDVDTGEIGPYTDPVTVTADFEGGSPLAPFDSTTGTSVTSNAAHAGSAGVRLDATGAASYVRIGPTTTGTGRRYVSLRAWVRLPSGTLTDNAPLIRFRNTDPLTSGGGGNGDVWVDSGDDSIRGDLQPADAGASSAGLFVANTWHLLRAVCAFKDDGTSSLKVALNGAQVWSVTSTLNVVGQALQFVDIGANVTNDSILDVDDLTCVISDSTLTYLAATIPIVLASEVDTAQTVARLKKRTVGIASATETAQPITAKKTRAVTLAAETDTAQTVAKSKRLTTGIASETDTAQVITPAIPSVLGIASETGTAVSVAGTKAQLANLASETDAAQPIAGSKAHATSVATETGTAQTVGATKTLNTAVAAATDTAQPLTGSKTRIVAVAGEADAAVTVSRTKTAAVTHASQTDTAMTLAAVTAGTIGAAEEIDTAEAAARTKSLPVGTAAGTDTARTAGRSKSAAVSAATAAETAQAVTAHKTRTAGTAHETATAVAFSGAVTAALAVAAATETAQPLGRVKTAALPVATASSGCQPFTRRKTRTVGVAAHQDTALAFAGGFQGAGPQHLTGTVRVAHGLRGSVRHAGAAAASVN